VRRRDLLRLASAAGAYFTMQEARAEIGRTPIEVRLKPAVEVIGRPAGRLALADRMAFYKTPAVSVALMEGGRLAATSASGYADVSNQRRALPDTLFQAASISKSLTALAALRLVANGQLALDLDVNQQLRSWQVPEYGGGAEPVTLRRLLSHSAGLGHNYFPGSDVGKPLPTALQILRGEAPATNGPIKPLGEPGKAFRYSNDSYVVIQLLLEETTCLPFPVLMRELVLNPLGMKQSTFSQSLPAGLLAKAATGYSWEAQALKGRWGLHADMAGGGLWSTPSDIARFAIAVHQTYRGERSDLIPRSLMHEALTRQIGNWGVGFGLSPAGQPARFRQTGSNEGFQCAYEMACEGGDGIVVMTNAVGGVLLVPEILRGFTTERGWGDQETLSARGLDLAAAGSLSGDYSIGDYRIASIHSEGGKLFVATPFFGAGPLELLPLAEDRFLIWPTHAVELQIHRALNGGVEKLSMRRGVFGVEGARVGF